MSLQPAIPWRVALQQSPPPLHRLDFIYHSPAETVNHHLTRAGEFSTGIMRNFQPVLTPHTRRPQQNHIGRFMHEPQCARLPHLTFVNRRPKREVELIESLDIRQVGRLQSRLEIALAARIGFRAHRLQQKVGESRSFLRSASGRASRRASRAAGLSAASVVRKRSRGSSCASHRQAPVGFQRLLDNRRTLLNVDERFPRARTTEWNALVMLAYMTTVQSSVTCAVSTTQRMNVLVTDMVRIASRCDL